MNLDESVADRENLTPLEAITDQINEQVADIISWVKTKASKIGLFESIFLTEI